MLDACVNSAFLHTSRNITESFHSAAQRYSPSPPSLPLSTVPSSPLLSESIHLPYDGLPLPPPSSSTLPLARVIPIVADHSLVVLDAKHHRTTVTVHTHTHTHTHTQHTHTQTHTHTHTHTQHTHTHTHVHSHLQALYITFVYISCVSIIHVFVCS